MPYTYMLRCNDGTYYTGWTTNVQKRVDTHNKGRGAKYTRCRLPVYLVYWEWQEDRSSAQKKEDYIRKLTRKRKEEIIKKFQECNEISSS